MNFECLYFFFVMPVAYLLWTNGAQVAFELICYFRDLSVLITDKGGKEINKNKCGRHKSSITVSKLV